MTIGWDDPPSSGGFPVLSAHIYVDNSLWASEDASKNTYQMTGLTLGTDYKIQISSENEIGESAKSPSARITFANRPDPPASLALSSTKGPTILASWTAPASSNGDLASGYRLYIDNSLGGEFDMVFDGSFDQPATFSFVIESGIVCGKIYYLEVTAVNVAGESDAARGEIWVGEPPSPPLFPRVTSIVPLDHVTISWDLPLDTGCLPPRHHSISRDGVVVDTVGPEDDFYKDEDVASFPTGALIVYKVSANNVAGDGEYSVELTVTVGQEPAAPSGIVISLRFSETSVEIQWDPDVLIAGNVATDSFLVYLDDLSGNTVLPVVASSPQHVLSGLVLGHTYAVSVSAVNSIGEGAQSTALSVHTGIIPSKMTGASAPVLSSSTSTSITISWLPPDYNGGASLTEYRVYHDIEQTGTFTPISITDMSTISYTLDSSSPGASSLSTGQLVDFFMTSVNVIGEGDASDILTLYVAAVPSTPDPPTESIVWATTRTSEVAEELAVQVNWTAPADNGSPILGYRLFMAEEQSPSQILYDGTKSRRADVFSFTLRTGIQKHLSYQFRLQALNAVGLSAISEPLSVLAAVVPGAPTELNVTGSG